MKKLYQVGVMYNNDEIRNFVRTSADKYQIKRGLEMFVYPEINEMKKALAWRAESPQEYESLDYFYHGFDTGDGKDRFKELSQKSDKFRLYLRLSSPINKLYIVIKELTFDSNGYALGMGEVLLTREYDISELPNKLQEDIEKFMSNREE